MRGTVDVYVDADPSVVWSLVSDVTRIGEFSPETFEAEWLDNATGPALGARFRGHVKRNGVGPVYWTTCKITSCEPERDFGFTVYGFGGRLVNWRYLLTPQDEGTLITESFHMEPRGLSRIYWAAVGLLRGRTNRRGMLQTLTRMKAIAEADTTV